ncbi:endonuclease MutS2 [Geomesophilobacter sediminis]|uniref:Endonuclease MutS2 n=1 Tax=Geomesophilobacter sediminis TaxID=2798584 RepID=A0A8J7M368_9BACT|nr:endonuclease MutS2 [Geomesophilobacter sediminis]MBJ6727817.1 endonuclease MutS2 [Geomesophilobacter sediminis]
MIDKEVLRRLEFDRILETVAAFAHCEASHAEALAIVPLTDRARVERRFGLVDEIRRLSRMGIALKLDLFADITPQLSKVRPLGAVLSPIELAHFIPTLRVMATVSRQIAFRNDTPLLQEDAGMITGFADILNPLEHTVNSEGEILDTASRLLADIRGRKRGLTTRIHRRLEEIVRERHTAIFLQAEFITQRSGRWVIPVRMDSKGMVPGVVHDVSNSGETAFMEPLEIIHLANELENLVADERAEEIRIVRQICDWIREDAEPMLQQFRALVNLDLLNCIALFSDRLTCETPLLADTPRVSLKEARHPILTLMGKEVVPLDLELAEADRVMVVTGPNTGGKTIAIKNVGILTLMAQSGMPIPASPDSVLPFVEHILVDIGDEQSIEESLSTFSAHISKIASILEGANRSTLVLLDELGTGTEPGQGAAIACAVLKELKDKGALVVATTHLTEIIGFVQREPGMVNAAMAFDREQLSPLYRLTQGEPGESHALEIARRYGLPERVVEFARSMVGTMQADFHLLLRDLKEKSAQWDRKLDELACREEAVVRNEQSLKEKQARTDAILKGAKEKGLQEAQEIIRKARREVAAIMEEARKEKAREARALLDQAAVQVEEQLAELQPERELPPAKVEAGELVFVKPLNTDARIVSVDPRGERVRVRAGSMELEVAVDALSKARGGKERAPAPRPRKKLPQQEERNEPKAEILLLGMRVEEALEQLEPFLNHASVDRMREVRVVHGKGTGALMRGVREFLEGHPLIDSYRTGERYEGGDGVTIVTMKQ